MIFKGKTSDGTERTLFVCQGNGGHCCDDYIELYSSSFFSDCGEMVYWFNVRSAQDLSFWNFLKTWWRWRQRDFLDIALSKKDLETLRDKITEELAKKPESTSKVNPVLITGINPDEKTVTIFDDSTKKESEDAKK